MVADRYEIRSQLGRGGMGLVLLAHDHELGRDVALKALRRELMSNPDSIARFEREIKLAHRFRHPGIVNLYEVHNWNGTLFYTMEYVDGRTLRCWLTEEKRADLKTAVDILCRVCDVLDYAHKSTIHRDLSPDNIMVLPDGSVRVLDFGLAKLDDRFAGLTVAGSNLGKLSYMAPEQELNAARVDRRADLYSLGIIFYELLAGHTPKLGEKLTRLRSDLPRETKAFMRRALARKPDERFFSAREFREALIHLQARQQARRKGVFPFCADLFKRGGAFLKRLIRLGA